MKYLIKGLIILVSFLLIFNRFSQAENASDTNEMPKVSIKDSQLIINDKVLPLNPKLEDFTSIFGKPSRNFTGLNKVYLFDSKGIKIIQKLLTQDVVSVELYYKSQQYENEPNQSYAGIFKLNGKEILPTQSIDEIKKLLPELTFEKIDPDFEWYRTNNFGNFKIYIGYKDIEWKNTKNITDISISFEK